MQEDEALNNNNHLEQPEEVIQERALDDNNHSEHSEQTMQEEVLNDNNEPELTEQPEEVIEGEADTVEHIPSNTESEGVVQLPFSFDSELSDFYTIFFANKHKSGSTLSYNEIFLEFIEKVTIPYLRSRGQTEEVILSYLKHFESMFTKIITRKE